MAESWRIRWGQTPGGDRSNEATVLGPGRVVARCFAPDAPLIAAAPDLLAALERIRDTDPSDVSDIYEAAETRYRQGERRVMRPLRTYRSLKLSIVRETASESYERPNIIRSSEDCVSLLRAMVGDDPRERFMAIYLDARHKVVAVHTTSIGTTNSSVVHPREVFGPALMLSANAMIVAHNHPSGDPKPSVQDRQITERLHKAADLLGIELLDHLIITHDEHYSFASEA